MKHERGKRICVISAQCRHSLKVPKFHPTTALQRCKLSFVASRRIRSRGTRDPTVAYDRVSTGRRPPRKRSLEWCGTLPAYSPVSELSDFLSFQLAN